MNTVQFENWIRYCPLKKVLNTADIQAVKDINGLIWGIAFYKPGSITLGPGIFISTDKPCLMLVHTNANQSIFKITISDPSATQSSINVSISKKLSGPGATINSDKTTTLVIDLPQGEEAGESISFEYTAEPVNNILSLARIIAYPNPSSGGFYLTDASSIKSINVFDQNGKLYYQSGVPENYEIGADWNPGVYYLKVEYSDLLDKKQKLIKIVD